MSKKIEADSAVIEKPRANGVSVPQAPERESSGASAQPIDPEILAKLTEVRTKIQASVGEIVLAMMNLPRYRHQAIADIMHLVLDPLMRDRIAIAKSNAEGKGDATAGIAIWASVSDEVDAKIREQIKGGGFPLRLNSEDWVSGDTMWLIDVIAPSRKLATAVLANFKQIVKDKPIRVHPIVARSVDPEILEKLRAAPMEKVDAGPAEA